MTAGKDFERRIRRRLEQAGCYVRKLPDVSVPFIDRPELGQTAARFAPRNPFDFIVLQPAGGPGVFRAYALECKSTAQPRFAVSTVAPHQVGGLMDFPGVSGVLVEIRPERRCFFVGVDVVSAWEETAGKRSMNVRDLADFAVELPLSKAPRERLAYYDVGPLLGSGPAVEQLRIECV